MIFELRATFDYFVTMLNSDVGGTCRRVYDAMLLEKIKQIHSCSNTEFQDDVDRSHLEATVKEITGRYSPVELDAIKKNGFTGISVEQRCQKVGHANAYQIMYRNLSRNVHATDFVEQQGALVFDAEYLKKYHRVRNHTVLFFGNWSAGGIIIQSDIDSRCKAEVQALQRKQKELKEVFKTLGKSTEVAPL